MNKKISLVIILMVLLFLFIVLILKNYIPINDSPISVEPKKVEEKIDMNDLPISVEPKNVEEKNDIKVLATPTGGDLEDIKVLRINLPKGKKKVDSKMKKITGKTIPNATLYLMCDKIFIKSTNSNNKGDFVFNKINLKRYKGETLKIVAYSSYSNVKTIDLTLKK